MSIQIEKYFNKKIKKILKFLLTNRISSAILTKLSRKCGENMAE